LVYTKTDRRTSRQTGTDTDTETEKRGKEELIVCLPKSKSIMIFNAQMGAITVSRVDKRIYT